jgi:uncharacterized surface anchored protein
LGTIPNPGGGGGGEEEEQEQVRTTRSTTTSEKSEVRTSQNKSEQVKNKSSHNVFVFHTLRDNGNAIQCVQTFRRHVGRALVFRAIFQFPNQHLNTSSCSILTQY